MNMITIDITMTFKLSLSWWFLCSLLQPSHRGVWISAFRLGFWLKARAPWEGDWSPFFNLDCLFWSEHLMRVALWMFFCDKSFVVYYCYQKLSDSRVISFSAKQSSNCNLVTLPGCGKPDWLPHRRYEWAGQLSQGFQRAHTLSLFYPHSVLDPVLTLCSRERRHTRRLFWDTVNLC